MAVSVYSAGARYERAALRAHIERKLKKPGVLESAYQSLLRWVRLRQSRYDKRPGGL